MLIYFHKNRLRSHKGQLAPLFIVLIVIFIIMAMVTVNLSKVVFIKTDSSNAVDSGALAAGSVMANVFNGVAVANSGMIASYEYFFYTIVIPSFAAASGLLTSAMASACSDPCSALEDIGDFIKVIYGIMFAVMGYQAAQYLSFLSIVDGAQAGRLQAIGLGYSYAFINSGIGSKLKPGGPPPEITDEEQKNNYRNEFSRFLDKEIGVKDEDEQIIALDKEYTYPWEDGQQRGHYVRVKVHTDELDTWDVRVTLLPLAAELLLFYNPSSYSILTLAYAAQASLALACACQGCCSVSSSCCDCRDANCAAAKSTMSSIPYWMAAALAGLAPGVTVSDDVAAIPLLVINAWIDAIDHNRLVTVDTTQHHQGADLGLWQTKYPDTDSYSVADFTGNGQIYSPVAHHDASIIETDKMGAP